MTGMENLLTIAGAAVVGGGVSIGTQLIVAYLKQGKNGNGKEKPFNICSDPLVTASDCRKKRMEFSDWKSGVDKCLVRQKSSIQEHEKLLDKGSKDFDAIKKDIAGINTSLAVFAEKLNKGEMPIKT